MGDREGEVKAHCSDAVMSFAVSAFGRHLRALLQQKSLTQKEFAQRVDYPHRILNAVVTGRRETHRPRGRTIPPDLALRWGRALGLDGAELRRFCDLAAIAHLPVEVQPRFEQMIETWYAAGEE